MVWLQTNSVGLKEIKLDLSDTALRVYDNC